MISFRLLEMIKHKHLNDGIKAYRFAKGNTGDIKVKHLLRL